MYTLLYHTPEGFDDLQLNSDGSYLTGLWFVGSKDASKHVIGEEEPDLPIFQETAQWLDQYFAGVEPAFTPRYRLASATPFREEVSALMRMIPYGELVTYRELAQSMAKQRGVERMSAQAVGGAVGWNPLCLIIPCHRVVGVGPRLTGYGGGLHNKYRLLQLEGHDMSRFKSEDKH